MADKNSGFLGGGPQFNKVGASATDDGTPEAVPTTPQSMQPYQVRNLIIIIVVLIMIGVLFFISDPGGVIHKEGGAQTLPPKPEVPSNF